MKLTSTLRLLAIRPARISTKVDDPEPGGPRTSSISPGRTYPVIPSSNVIVAFLLLPMQLQQSRKIGDERFDKDEEEVERKEDQRTTMENKVGGWGGGGGPCNPNSIEMPGDLQCTAKHAAHGGNRVASVAME